MDQWEGKSVFHDCESFLTVLSQSIRSNTNNVIPSVTNKKRSHENIIDQVSFCNLKEPFQFLVIQDEEAQIAIALAASMKNKKRQKIHHSDSDHDDQSDGAEPEMNSDFESIDGDDIDLEDGINIF